MVSIGVIKVASKSIMYLPQSLFFPLFPLVLVFCILILFGYTTLLIMSRADTKQIEFKDKTQWQNIDGIDNNANEYTRKIYKSQKFEILANIGLFCWIFEIIIYGTYLTLSGVIADWYFTKKDKNNNKIRGNNIGELSNFPLLSSLYRSIRYHIGTICFAGAIITIIKVIRIIVLYLQKMFDFSNSNKLKNLKCIKKVLFSCTNCLLKCLECILDKINKNALVYTAVYGTNFCVSASHSLSLILSNFMRMSILHIFSKIVLIIGRLFIILGTVLIICIMLIFGKNSIPYYDDEVNHRIIFLIFIGFISFSISKLFCIVFEVAIDTVFICFLIDEKHNKSNGKMLADQELKNIVQKYENESKEYASKSRNRSTITSLSKNNNDEGYNSYVETVNV